jgi:hypothetical protein
MPLAGRSDVSGLLLQGLRDHIWTPPARGCAINDECWAELRLQSYLRPLWGAHTLRAMRESRARGEPIDGNGLRWPSSLSASPRAGPSRGALTSLYS